jgi:hypothetical protein
MTTAIKISPLFRHRDNKTYTLNVISLASDTGSPQLTISVRGESNKNTEARAGMDENARKPSKVKLPAASSPCKWGSTPPEFRENPVRRYSSQHASNKKLPAFMLEKQIRPTQEAIARVC